MLWPFTTQITDNILVAVLATVASLAAALVAQYLAKRQQELSRRSEETARSIATLIRTRQDERRASTLATLVEKLPAGASPEQFVSTLEPLVIKLTEVTPEARAQPAPVESLVNAYHEQALSQAKVQFWFSVVAATIGFGWILYAGTAIDVAQLSTLSKTLPGIVIDTVAFLFFKQAAETRQRATDLYDRLRSDRQISDSVVLVAAIEDVRVRSAVRAQIALHMSGLQPAAIDLTHFLEAEGARK